MHLSRVTVQGGSIVEYERGPYRLRSGRSFSRLDAGGLIFAILLTLLSLAVDRRPLAGPGAVPPPDVLEWR